MEQITIQNENENSSIHKMNDDKKNCLETIHNWFELFLQKYQTSIKRIVIFLLNLGFIIYFILATIRRDLSGSAIPFCDQDQYGLLIILFAFTYLLIIYGYIFKPYILPKLKLSIQPCTKCIRTYSTKNYIKALIYLLILGALLTYIIIDSYGEKHRLIACSGFLATLLFGFVFSKHPGKIKIHPIITGIIVQFALGLFTIRWEQGRNIFKCIGDKITTFLKYTDVGSSFAYGDDLIKKNVFMFEALSVIFFLSFFVNILYYYGIIQKVVLAFGWLLQKLIGTTMCESVNSVANIFLGMTEAPLLLKPYLPMLTKSELHAVMAAGFGTVSATVFGAYISFGAKASHLITSSVISAPAALCFSKLYYPETEQTTPITDVQINNADDSSVLDAASKGASQAIAIVLGITANVIAFITFITFVNAALNWFGVLINQPNWTIEILLAYVFMPISYIMGVPWNECYYVARLIGIKTILNEFVAYKEMGDMLKQNLLSKRTEAIATYAICGFSNLSSIGIMIGGMDTLMPGHRNTITSLIYRAFISGLVICFMTASIAGILLSEQDL